MGLLRVGHNWVTSLSLFTYIHWRRKWQPTPVLLPGESQGWGSLVGCHLWGCTESDYVPQLSYPFICWWTSRLLPCLGYYKQCCDEHWGTRVSFNSDFLLCVCPAVGLLGHMAVLFPVFKGISTLFFIVAVLVCIPTNSVRGFPFLHIFSSIYCL